MLLLTGERITVTHFRPSPMAVAMHLARLPRFGGSLREDCDHWSVLHHSLLVCEIAKQAFVQSCYPSDGHSEKLDRIMMGALVHDATEIAIMDIPRPFKIQEMRAFEVRLLNQLYEAWGLTHSGEDVGKAVKAADTMALVLEANRVAMPGLLELIMEECGMTKLPELRFASYIEGLLEYGDTIHRKTTYSRATLVSMYRNRVHHLLHKLDDPDGTAERWGLPADPTGKMYP